MEMGFFVSFVVSHSLRLHFANDFGHFELFEIAGMAAGKGDWGLTWIQANSMERRLEATDQRLMSDSERHI